MLVLPDETPAHPLVSSVEVASLCPNAEITVFPWREPPELEVRTIDRVRKFLGDPSTIEASAPEAHERTCAAGAPSGDGSRHGLPVEIRSLPLGGSHAKCSG